MSQAGKPLRQRPRWRQFSLKTLLLFVLLGGTLLGLCAAHLERQRRHTRAVARLQAAGLCIYSFGSAVVTTEPGFGFCGTGLKYFHGPTGAGPVTDNALPWLVELDDLESLTLAGTDVSDAGLKHLAGLRGVRQLSLAGTRITDAGLPDLAKLAHVEALDVTNTGLSDNAVARLQGLLPHTKIHYTRDALKADWRALKSLGKLTLVPNDAGGAARIDVSQCKFGDADCAHLATFGDVESLNFAGTAITDRTVASLSGLARLQQLDLQGTAVTDAGAAELRANHPGLEISRVRDAERAAWTALVALNAMIKTGDKDHITQVRLRNNLVRDADLAVLTQLPQLAMLDLSAATAITDNGIAHVAGLSNLTDLMLGWTAVTDAGILAHVVKLENLKTLSLRQAAVSDACVEPLASMKNLTSLDLSDTMVTSEEVAKVKANPATNKTPRLWIGGP